MPVKIIRLILTAGLLVGLAGASLGAVTDLRLNELQSDNEQTLPDDFDEHDDWLEIINTGPDPVDLEGLFLSDDADLATLHLIDGSVVVPAGGRRILWADGQPGQGPTHLSFRLSSSGESVTLLAEDGLTVLDAVEFPRQFTDRVYQRFPDATGAWTWGRDPSPGFANTAPHHEGFLLLNELMSSNATVISDNAGDFDPWLEIANPLPVPVATMGMELADAVGTSTPLPTLDIPSQGYLLLWLDGEAAEGPEHLLSLLSVAGGGLVLTATDGATTDSVIYPGLATDEAHARIPDGGQWQTTELATPGQTNPATLEPLLVINEFLASNQTGIVDETGAFEDWVEIFNPGTAPVPLLGLSLTDDLTIPDKWLFPDQILPPGGFLLIWCDNDPEDGLWHATFKLAAAGEEIGLYDGDQLLDSVVFGPQTTDVSTGRRIDAGLPWITFVEPTPGATNGHDVGVDEIAAPLPRLAPPFPNPFNPRTEVVFELPAAGSVRLQVFDLRGRRLRDLVHGSLTAGRHAVVWAGDDDEGRGLPSGVYCLRLVVDRATVTRRVTLVQ